MKDCPEGKICCPCSEYSKEGFCDWPYRNGMTFHETRFITEVLSVVKGVRYAERARQDNARKS
jgi:hypothetical protein